MKIFISGPMSGYAEWNFPAFYAVEAGFKALGHEVCNPARIFTDLLSDGGLFPSWEDCMRIIIPELMKCEALVALNAWENSLGACMEIFLAKKLKMKFLDQFGIDITNDINTPFLMIGDVIL